MVGPGRKREAVAHVRASLGTSERRACKSLGQPRSTQRYTGRRREVDASLVKAIRQVAGREPRAGYRSVAKYLRRDGWVVNDKRIHRLWKQEGLKVAVKGRKRRRLGQSSNGAQRLSAERINHVWSYDFVFDQTEGGRRLKWLPILDEHTRESSPSKGAATAFTKAPVISTHPNQNYPRLKVRTKVRNSSSTQGTTVPRTPPLGETAQASQSE